VAGDSVPDDALLHVILWLQLVFAQDRVKVLVLQGFEVVEVHARWLVFHEQGKRELLVFGVAAEDLGALKVGLLKRDETKQKLENRGVDVIKLNDAVAWQLVFLFQLEYVRLAKLLPQTVWQNQVVLGQDACLVLVGGEDFLERWLVD